MGFYEQANERLKDLNEGERSIFEHVVKNLDRVRGQSVRELAADCAVSSTTIVRFAKKLGYAGWGELSLDLRDAARAAEESSIPLVLRGQEYAQSYLRNITESIRTVTQEQMTQVKEALCSAGKVYCFAEGADWDVSRYAYRMLMALGFDTVLVEDSFERAAVCRMAKRQDVSLVFSLDGESRETVEFVERLRQVEGLTVISITRADNNTVQGLSDLNLYVFTDRVLVDGQDLSSRISMFVMVDLLSYGIVRDR